MTKRKAATAGHAPENMDQGEVDQMQERWDKIPSKPKKELITSLFKEFLEEKRKKK